jgi:hypothetical protein
MSSRPSRVADELAKFARAAWLDLPLAAAKLVIGAGDEKNLTKAGWTTYDAWVRLANEATNELYANRFFGDLTGRTMESVLRVQQVSDAMASAFFGKLWNAVGLPTASEIRTLRDEVVALREEVCANVDASHEQAQEQRPFSSVPPALPDDGFNVVRGGTSQTLRQAGEEKERAAA